MGRCVYCRSELPTNESVPTERGNPRCEKCTTNEARYGKPQSCLYCQLPAAFRDKKCVYCAYSERKSGPPRNCSNCNKKNAFPKDPKSKEKLLCRLCKTDNKRKMEKTKPTTSSTGTLTRNEDTQDIEKKRLKTSISRDNSSNDLVSGEHILFVTQLKDQIFELQKRLIQKDGVIMERDKKMASLNAAMMRLEKEHKTNIRTIEKGHEESMEKLQEKVRFLSRQVASLSRGKKFHIDSASNSPLP